MLINTEFCEEIVSEYSKRFTEAEIRNGYKGMDIHTARIAMEVFRLAFERISREELPSSAIPTQPELP